MNYLIISPVACGLYTVPRLLAERDTEKVFLYIRDFPKMEKVGHDLDELEEWKNFELIKDPFEAINEIPINNITIIFDDNGLGHMADHFRRLGYAVVQGGSFADKLENDRWGAIQLMQKIMDVPETEYFETFEQGIAFLSGKEKSERWVFKPQDNEVPKDKTHVGRDIKDLVNAMTRFKAEWSWEPGFVLQQFVDGIEGDINAYFDGKEYLKNSFGWYFENKPSMVGDIGPATGGEIAAIVFRPNEGEIFKIFEKLKPLLIKKNYHGQIAINCMFSKEDHKPYFLELTPRFGYPSLELEITMLEENGKSYADLVKALAFGQKEPLFPTDKIGVMCTVSTPPYPVDEGAEKLTSEMPVSWDKKWSAYMFPWFMMKDPKRDGYALAGYSGHALSVTCADTTLDGAVSMLLDTYVPSIHIQNKQYRNDVGQDAKKRMKELKSWGVMT